MTMLVRNKGHSAVQLMREYALMLHALQTVANIQDTAAAQSSGGSFIHASCRTIDALKWNHIQRLTAQAKLDRHASAAWYSPSFTGVSGAVSVSSCWSCCCMPESGYVCMKDSAILKSLHGLCLRGSRPPFMHTHLPPGMQ